MLGRFHSFGWARAIAAVCLSLLFAFAGLTPLAAQLLKSSNCAMVCCKGAKAACHRSGHGDSHSAGWTSGEACPQGCGQALALPGSAGLSLVPGEFGYNLSLQTAPFRPAFLQAWSRPGAEFSLFERPPPTLG